MCAIYISVLIFPYAVSESILNNYVSYHTIQHHTTATILRSFFWDHPGEPVPQENLWTLCCKRRLTEADTPTIRLGATPSRLTSAHLHYPPIFFAGWMPFLPPNQQHQSTEGNSYHTAKNTIWLDIIWVRSTKYAEKLTGSRLATTQNELCQSP